MVKINRIIVMALALSFFSGRGLCEDNLQIPEVAKENLDPKITKSITTRTSVVEFPKQQRVLKSAIEEKCAEIEIYIPRPTLGVPEYKIDPDILSDSDDFTNIETLVIKHSIKSDSGINRLAIEALLPLIKGSRNLKKIIITHVLLDYFLPYLPRDVQILLECSCCYRASDTVKPVEQLKYFANAQLEIYRDKYPGYDINIVPIPTTLFGKF